MKYDYHVSSRRKKKFLRRVYLTAIAFLLLVALAVAAIRLDGYLSSQQNTPESTTSQQSTEYFAPSTNIFSSPYFQFQTDKNWAEAASESTKNKFVYRSLRSNLVEHELTIFVDNIPSTLSANRVLPVISKKDDSELSAGSTSDHCIKANGGVSLAADKMLNTGGVDLLCDLDNTSYVVLAGEKGGSTKMTLKRPDGGTAVYSILYKNVTAKPDSVQLYDIISSFQTR
jgi:hypothetical protein